MGKKAKTSRKGKKAWRANISTQDFDDYFEKTTKDALSGGSLADASNESLFFVDKSRDLSVKRKIDKAREKVLRVDSMLQRNPFIQAVPTSTQKSKKTLKKKEKGAEGNVKDGSASGLADLWDEKDEIKRKSKKKSKSSIIPAVEVEHPGCSFNPDPESHQDALACAVADEMQKIYQQELGPEPIPSTVIGEVIDEEEKFFLDADEGTDDDDDQNEVLNDGGDADVEKRSRKAERITRVQLNKRARHKDRLKAVAESKKAGALSKEIDSLGAILKEIKKEDAEKEKRRVRCMVAKQERLKVRPPRLGKYKFDPAPMQVLLSEEKTGSLRQLKGCCTLVKDRFKSLEKRGLIIPTRKSSRK